MMLTLAWQTLRYRRAGFVGTFVALAFAATLVSAFGVLMESGLRSGMPAERYAGTSVVVTGRQAVQYQQASSEDPQLEPVSERVRIPATLIDRLAGIPGVRAAVADVSFRAVVTVNGRPVTGPAGRPSWGHSWDAAVLAPFELRPGGQPDQPGEVVLDDELADRAGVRVGDRVAVQMSDRQRSYLVVGLAAPAHPMTSQAALFFSPDEAVRLAGHPGRIDAIGVLADGSVSDAKLRDRIAAALSAGAPPAPALDVRIGASRGNAEFLDATETSAEVVELSGAFGSVVLMVTMFVVAATFSVSIAQRHRELALLRAVGATRQQLRRLVVGESALVALASGAVACLPGVALAYGLREALVALGVFPGTFVLAVSPWPLLISVAGTLLAATVAAWVAGRRTGRIRPTEALTESATEPRRVGWIRVGFGLLFVAASAGLIGLSLSSTGDVAGASAVSVMMTLITAVALLGPFVARAALGILGRALRLASVGGYLAAEQCRVNARRLASAVIPIALTIALACTIIFSQTMQTDAARQQVNDGLRADRVLAGGLPFQAAAAARALPGVAAATGVLQTEVTVVYREFDGKTVNTLAAQALDTDRVSDTLDLGVRSGSLADLHAGTVAVAADTARAMNAEIGSPVTMWLGDGTPAELTIVAVYDRGLGFAPVTLPHDLVAGHVTDQLDSLVLVRLRDDPSTGLTTETTDAALRALAAQYADTQLLDRGGYRAQQQTEQDVNLWTNLLLVGLLMAFTGISVVNTLAMSTMARAREYALLRLIGATASQVTNMMRCEALLIAATGAIVGTAVAAAALMPLSRAIVGTLLPSVSFSGYAGIAGGTTLLAYAATMSATRRVMRGSAKEVLDAT
jgi:putative ABC transport system permease protein